ncbi:GNAT family N-acetyltransferase [Lentibacillus saliphilus]|uniref:GNAT family N-acetyltransferase n=1 Tax=Lentibacillus saliphilus TaxID=2737028 RepID=UPI001C307971|nr:GNAT family N-acetyltransferase [Lentibacillus saliphilus]
MKLIELDMRRSQELVSLWNQELGQLFPMRRALFEQNSFADENVCHASSRIAVDHNGKLIGFVVVKRWQEQIDVGMDPEKGWIQAILVDASYRHQGIGKALLNNAEHALSLMGIKEIWLGRDPWHYFPGIPKEYEQVAKWFKMKGYLQQGFDYDMLCTYDISDRITVQEHFGIEFSVLNIAEKEDLLKFMHRCFPGRWEYETIKYFQKGGTGREFVVLKKDNRIIGFCRINDDLTPIISQNVYWAPLFDEKLGGVGPLGIDATERKRGFGLEIVKAGIAELRKRHIQRIVIDWTGLVDFYGKLGFDVWKTYQSYKKTIS